MAKKKVTKKKAVKKKAPKKKKTNRKSDRTMRDPKPYGYSFGRPTKFKPEYCQLLVDHMGSGLTFESFAGTIDVDRATIYAWVDSYQDFHDAKKCGASASLLWSEKFGRAGMGGQLSRNAKKVTHKDKDGNVTKIEETSERAVFSAAAWIFGMKNKHNWTDRREITGAGGGPLRIKDVSDMTDEEIQKELDDLEKMGV